MTHAHVFDFDGVLAHPYTHPELLVPGAERLLRALSESENHIVMVASFNPRAYHVLRDLYKEEEVIAEMRAGSNHALDAEWWRPEEGNGHYEDAKHRPSLSKSEMIKQMLRKRAGPFIVHFYDDDIDNIEEVKRRMPHVQTHFVPDSSKGISAHYDEWFQGVIPPV